MLQTVKEWQELQEMAKKEARDLDKRE